MFQPCEDDIFIDKFYPAPCFPFSSSTFIVRTKYLIMNQSAVYPSSTHEGSAPYGYPQQPPLNQLHTGPTPSPHGNQMSAANLASSYASMAVTNAAPNAQFPTQANHPSNMSSPPPSAAYPYSSGPSPNGPVSGYLQATENNQTPHSAYAQEGYTPVNQGMGAPSYPPANPTTQGFDPHNSYNVSVPPQGFSNPSPPVNYHSPTTLPNSPPIPQSLNSPVAAQQPPTPIYSPAGGTYPGTFSPISPTGPGFAYNSPPAAHAPFSPTGPPTQHMVPQFSPTTAPGPYQPSQAVPNVNPHSPPPPQQMYGQGPQMSSPTAMSPATDANKGAAADYYGKSLTFLNNKLLTSLQETPQQLQTHCSTPPFQQHTQLNPTTPTT